VPIHDALILTPQIRSISVDYYTYTYPNDPIVTGLIMDSGTAFSPIAVNDSTHSNFTFVAEHVGCGGLAADPEKQLSCERFLPQNPRHASQVCRA